MIGLLEVDVPLRTAATLGGCGARGEAANAARGLQIPQAVTRIRDLGRGILRRGKSQRWTRAGGLAVCLRVRLCDFPRPCIRRMQYLKHCWAPALISFRDVGRVVKAIGVAGRERRPTEGPQDVPNEGGWASCVSMMCKKKASGSARRPCAAAAPRQHRLGISCHKERLRACSPLFCLVREWTGVEQSRVTELDAASDRAVCVCVSPHTGSVLRRAASGLTRSPATVSYGTRSDCLRDCRLQVRLGTGLGVTYTSVT